MRIFTGSRLGTARAAGLSQLEEIRSPHRVVGSWVARIFHRATARRQGRSYPRFRVWVRPLRLPSAPIRCSASWSPPLPRSSRRRPAPTRCEREPTPRRLARTPSSHPDPRRHAAASPTVRPESPTLASSSTAASSPRSSRPRTNAATRASSTMWPRSATRLVPAGVRFPVRREDRRHVRRSRARQRGLQLNARVRRVEQHLALLSGEERRLAAARGRRQRHLRRPRLALHHDRGFRRAITASRRSRSSGS